MYLLIILVFLFCFLTIIYRYSKSSFLFETFESEKDSIKLQKRRRFNDKENLAPYNDIVGIASTNVPAYSNGDDTHYSNENSYLHGVYMGLKWQCVEYARRWTFLRKSSTIEDIKSANNMWNQLKYVQRLNDKQKFALKQHPNGSPRLPTNESYLIYPIQEDLPDGHVAVIVDVLPNAVRVAEQNFDFHYWSNNYSREIPIVFENGLYYIQDEYEVYGWMEIDDNKQLKPLDEITITKIQKKNDIS